MLRLKITLWLLATTAILNNDEKMVDDVVTEATPQVMILTIYLEDVKDTIKTVFEYLIGQTEQKIVGVCIASMKMFVWMKWLCFIVWAASVGFIISGKLEFQCWYWLHLTHIFLILFHHHKTFPL